jgi:hypothetical protein
MKVSEWLRRWQISGEVPDEPKDPMIAFWAGWLTAAARQGRFELRTFDEAREMAIKVAEFIEERAR